MTMTFRFEGLTIVPALLLAAAPLLAQQELPPPEATEVWEPVPQVVDPGPFVGSPVAPSDAIVLFDGANLDEWVNVSDGEPAGWRVHDGIVTVEKDAGDIMTRRTFGNYQLHVEWRVPADVTGEGQGRGNSGLYMAYLGRGRGGYELQIVDSYENETYVNGMAGSVYKQSPPLVNAARPPGEWQSYDVIWTAPRFADDGAMTSPARVTAFFNGVLVQDDFALKGETVYRGYPEYHPYDRAAIMLQAHGDPSPPISFRNAWLRELP